MAHIGIKIKERREQLGLTQEELANKLGYKSKSTINKIEMGINDISQTKIRAFADALETSIAYLMDWEDNATTENAEFIPDLLSDSTLLEYVKKISLLTPEHKQTIYDNIEFLYNKEGH